MNYDIGKAAEKLGIGEKFLKDHINVFYRDFVLNQDKIRERIKTADFDGIYFEFHRLKSTFRMISATDAEELCSRCCDLSKENKPFDYGGSLEQIITLAESLNRQINGAD